MSDNLGTYSFLSWLRTGIANQIVGGASEGGRAVVNVQLRLDGTAVAGGEQDDTIGRNVALFGPGDIQGIDRRAIVRVEPRDWITNFETNYFPFIEFYDEDFIWRYSPRTPDGDGRLQPWIALVVLEERELAPEFTNGQDVRNKPLPYIEVTDRTLFPPAEQLWAWGHVHVNRGLAATNEEFVSTKMDEVLPKFRNVLAENADLAYSRLMCPRKLAPHKAYHAFLVPVFESGRRAGLGLDPFNDPALPAVTTSAWEDYGGRPEPDRYPYYHRWYFRTAGEGDFESLVRLLKPQPVDNRVGRRDIDVQHPGMNVRGVQAGRPDLNGVLKLGGALRVPEVNFVKPAEKAEYLKYENWATPYPQPIQEDLATLINLADDYAALAAEQANDDAGITDPDDPNFADPDPVITAPLYGTWHAMQKRLLVDRNDAHLPRRDNWVHELNLDPRFRLAAGFGTRVIQDQQEKYMDAAWSQVGKVLEANERIRRGQLARDVSTIWYDRHLLPVVGVSHQQALLLLAPLNKRVVLDGLTVNQQFSEAFVQPTMLSAPLRRIIRPRGRLMQSVGFTAEQPSSVLLDRVNAGEVSAAPPKVTPPGAETLDDLADAVEPKDAPKFVLDWIRDFPWLRWALLLVLLFVLLLVLLFAGTCVAIPFAGVLLALGIWLFLLLTRWTKALQAADVIRDESPDPATVDGLPKWPDFEISTPGSGVVPRPGATDSLDAINFKAALKEIYVLLGASTEAGKVPPKKQLDLPAVATGTLAKLDPQILIPKRVMTGIYLPPHILVELPEVFVEAMAYPVIDQPMYEPLKNISSELFLPNIHLIAENSITIVETNQKFIESYMVGINHEFARELLWREYPTDQRGSSFRQFWDASSFYDPNATDAEATKEKLRDIPPLHLWSRNSKLGEHDHRETDGEVEEEVVLVIRGELLKRYPTAVIYAHRAIWQRPGGVIDKTLERRLAPLSAAEAQKPPRDKVKTPLYEAKVDPDIYFFGFDITVDEARGNPDSDLDEDAGWFFIIKERPGEPRFGLDIDKQTPLAVWNDLSWPDVQPGPPGSYVQITGATPTFNLTDPGATDEKHTQHLDDVKVSWNANMNSSEIAYVTFQAPVLVAIHATDMLRG